MYEVYIVYRIYNKVNTDFAGIIYNTDTQKQILTAAVKRKGLTRRDLEPVILLSDTPTSFTGVRRIFFVLSLNLFLLSCRNDLILILNN